MAVENGYGTELDMVVDEENNDSGSLTEKRENEEKNETSKNDSKEDNTANGKEESSIKVNEADGKEENIFMKGDAVVNNEEENSNLKDDEPTTSVLMEVEEVQETDLLASDNDSEEEKNETSKNDSKEDNTANGKEENSMKVNEADGKEKNIFMKGDAVVNNEEGNSNLKDDEPTTSVLMEVEEVQETDLLASDNDSEDKIITPSKNKTDNSNEKKDDSENCDSGGGKNDNDDIPPPEPVVTEYVKEFTGRISGRSSRRSTNSSIDTSKVKIKEEPAEEIVLIDSEDEKEEKPKVKVVATRNMQIRQNVKSAGRSYNTNSRNSSSDFQIVSVDDDSPMNKNDPMNVFLCSTEEREFRKDYFKDPSSNVLKQRLHCTICDIHIGACPQNSKNMVCHRFLKVLICRKCANFYGQGDFPQDEGSDEFCRWCGEGGEVFLCNSCSNVFCQACILRNFGMNEVKRVDRLENWDCYVCDTRPLWTLRAIAFALFTYVRRIKVVAYRNGMYQTINSSNAKVSKSDLMALETDLSTCCPKEVKAAAAAASAPPPSETEKHSTSDNRGLKPKDNKVVNQTTTRVRTPPNKSSEASKFVPNNVYNQQQPSLQPRSTPKRSKQMPSKQMTSVTTSAPAPAPSWQQPQPSMLPDYYAATTGKRVSNQPPYAMTQQSVMFPQQSTLRTALVGQQQGYVSPQQMVPNTFGGPSHLIMFGGTSALPGGNESQSERNVLQWFNGILISLMETMKNIDNRLVFIRNSMSNLISQNEVSFLVNQLHNLLKVSCSKMQEVDCDLLKNYKEFIDKSEISVNDFDEIVREFPEFFKPAENNPDPPENNDTDPEPSDDFNPMALVEVIEDGDQPPPQSQSSNDSSKPSASSSRNEKTSSNQSSTSKTNSTPASSKSLSLIQPCSVTIKKEVICDDSAASSDIKQKPANNHSPTVRESSKRKAETKGHGKSKIQVVENIRIKKEVVDPDEDIENNETDNARKTGIKNCSVLLTNNIITSSLGKF